MRQRSISAIGVVLVAIIPAIFGGPVFSLTVTILCLVGLYEYQNMAEKIGGKPISSGFVALALFAIAAGFNGNEAALLAACAVAVFGMLLHVMFRPNLEGAFTSWALGAAGVLYLGIPLFATVSMRNMNGAIDTAWLNNLAGWFSLGWSATPRGLAWFLTILVITWLSDTGAYLFGRTFGKRPLIPRISPKKTIEGLAGGLVAAAITGAIAVTVFGLGIGWWYGILIGLGIGVVGVVGDLAESLLKRQSGVKDSGALIPGHGGMLDRLDALLFTWTAGWLFATFADRALL